LHLVTFEINILHFARVIF